MSTIAPGFWRKRPAVCRSPWEVKIILSSATLATDVWVDVGWSAVYVLYNMEPWGDVSKNGGWDGEFGAHLGDEVGVFWFKK